MMGGLPIDVCEARYGHIYKEIRIWSKHGGLHIRDFHMRNEYEDKL